MKPRPILAHATRLLLFVNLLTLPLLAADANLKDDLANLQGKWKATVTTDDGSSVWTLVVKGNKSNLVIESKDGNPVFKGELEFKLERHGSFKTYTYWNLKILSGDKEGETQLTDGKTKSSLYKLDSDTFTTISGFREDDEDKPVLIKWEKVPDAKK